MALNSNTELGLINTNTNAGSITLPPCVANQGRIITFKDSVGKFGTNTLTLICSGSDTFEDNGTRKVLRESYGSIQIVASGTKWYILNGTQVNTIQVSTLNTITISSINISTLNTQISSLNFIDNRRSTNTLYGAISSVSTQAVSTNFLYYNNYIIAGTRVGYSNVLNRFSFSPSQIPGLSLWLDASELSLFSLSAATSTISLWRDKSGNSNNALQNGSPVYNSTLKYINTINGGFLTLPYTLAPYSNYSVFVSHTYFTTASLNTFVFGDTNTIFPQDLMLYRTNNQGRAGWIISGGNSLTNISSINTTSIHSVVARPGAATQWFDGTSFGSQGVNPRPTLLSTSQYKISATQSSGSGCPTYLYEILTYNTFLTTLQRQQVEGYLAWKWNGQSNLPADHPYKNAPP